MEQPELDSRTTQVKHPLFYLHSVTCSGKILSSETFYVLVSCQTGVCLFSIEQVTQDLRKRGILRGKMRIIIYPVALFPTAKHTKYFNKFQISPKLKKICASSCFTVSANFVQKSTHTKQDLF